MFATALIVFRESLEAALFIGVIAAAMRGFTGRGRWLGTGIGLGALGAVALALMAGRLASWMDGLGQDVVHIGVLGLALAMLLWHCVWVTPHAREQAQAARALGREVNAGARAPWALVTVVALSVLREGAETVLFVSGAITGQAAGSAGAVALAGAAGLAAGVAVGAAMFAGLSRVPTRHVFAVTNVLVALLAAAIASQLARALAQAGFIDAGTTPLWDSSALLATDSPVGAVLHGLVGYDARPSLAQLVFYAAVLLIISFGTRWPTQRLRPSA